MTPEEDSVYMKAFSASKAKTVKERMAEADAALKKHREGGTMRAVEKGIKQGNLASAVKARMERVNKAIDGAPNKK